MRFGRVMVTGHRPQFLSPDSQAWAERELERVAVKLRDQHGMQVGISGMSPGAGMWWGLATLYAWQELWSFMPFEHLGDESWSNAEVATLKELRSRAAHEVIVGRFGDAQSSWDQLRQAHADAMLGNSDLVVAVWDPSKTTGGTVSDVQKAQQRGLPILHLDPVAQTATMRAPGR